MLATQDDPFMSQDNYQWRVELTGNPLAVLSITTCPLSAENWQT